MGNRGLAAKRHAHQRRARGEPLVPARDRERDGALHDGRTHDRPNHIPRLRHQLVPEALGVGVDVGPAPAGGLLHSQIPQPRPDPVLALPRERESQRSRIVGIAPLLGQAAAGRLPERVDPRLVLRLVPHPGREPVAILDLPIHPEFLVVAVAPREITDQRLVLADFAASVSGDEAGAGVDQRRAFHSPGELEDVPRAVYVGGDRGLERRV